MTAASGKAEGGADALEPCPFCGDKPVNVAGGNGRIYAFSHPINDCLLSNHSFDCSADGLPQDQWNRRALLATAAAANGPGEAVDDGELWSWLKKVMEQGASIHQDYMAGRHKGYEQYSARMDAAASERTDELIAMLPALASTPQPGMVTVPREPTKEMLTALTQEWHPSRHTKMRERYRAMLDAALRSGGRETEVDS